MADIKCTRAINDSDNTVAFSFPGLDQAQFPPLEAALDRMRDMLTRLALLGTSEKISNAFSGEKDHSECYNIAREQIEMLERGEWGKKRQKGEASITLIVEAIARQRSMDPQDVKTIWDGLDDDAKARIKADDNTKATVLAIKAERAAAKAAQSQGESESALSAFG